MKATKECVLPNEGYQRVVETSHINVSCSLAKVRLTPMLFDNARTMTFSEHNFNLVTSVFPVVFLFLPKQQQRHRHTQRTAASSSAPPTTPMATSAPRGRGREGILQLERGTLQLLIHVPVFAVVLCNHMTPISASIKVECMLLMSMHTACRD